MLTKKALQIRAKIDSVGIESPLITQLSNDLIAELVENCKPTKEEFAKIADLVEVSAGSFYDLIMVATDKWQP